MVLFVRRENKKQTKKMPFYWGGRTTGLNAMFDNKGNLTGYIQSGKQPACISNPVSDPTRCPAGVPTGACYPATVPTCPTHSTATLVPGSYSNCICQIASPPQF